MGTITFMDQPILPPVINSITINQNIPVNTRVYGTINFSDPDADVTWVDFLSILNFTDFNFDPNVLGIRSGNINFYITCNRVGVPFSAEVVLTDQANNASNVVPLNFTCVGNQPVQPQAPVINSITINGNIPVNTRVYGTINFSDPDADVTRVDFRWVLNFTDFNFDPNVLGSRSGNINFFITCNRVGVPFSAEVVLTDQANNASNVVPLNFTCVR